MQVSELANRYGRAIFELSKEAGRQEQVLDELRVLQSVFSKDAAIAEYFHSPLSTPEDQEKVLTTALRSSGVSPETLSFVMLLAEKGRLPIFDQIVEAMKVQSDVAHGVTRGDVRSATVLSPEERKKIEETVGKYTGKQVIMNYKEDPTVIGGLIAEVGTYTFDDTLTSHLRRLKDEMTRRVQ